MWNRAENSLKPEATTPSCMIHPMAKESEKDWGGQPRLGHIVLLVIKISTHGSHFKSSSSALLEIILGETRR